MDACPTESKICLETFDSYDIEKVYSNLSNAEIVNEFLTPKPEDNAGELPSSHVDSTVVPEVSTGTEDSSFGQSDAFVSANVEESLAYKPSAESAVATVAYLKDTNGYPIAGVQFYTRSKQGITDEAGKFQYIWGEEITFGIDTFTFGKVKGNQLEYKLTDVSNNEIIKQNIQHLAERYDTDNAPDTITFGPKVHEVFALYPNVINEAISFTLPNGAELLDDKGQSTGFKTPDEFNAQFEVGIAALIEADLKASDEYYFSQLFRQPQTIPMSTGGYVTNTLKALYQGVNQFHVFHDSYSWYGASGDPRGQRALNLSNRAFPIMMARNDNSHWLEFGSEAAWTRGSGTDKKAYFVNATVLDENSTATLERPITLDKDNVTFNLPFVTAGEIGAGKVVYMGNSMYPSILSCPSNYWAGAELSINGEENTCTYSSSDKQQADDSRNDDGAMAQFFTNMFKWLTPDYQGKSIATNIELAYAFEAWKANKTYPFFIDPSFGFSQLEHYTSKQYGSLNPTVTPIIILQGYEQITEGYDTKLTHANIKLPLLNQDDITDLIRYVSKGGNIVIMEAIGPRNPEPIARLFDSAGMVVGEANTIITRQAHCGSSYYCPDKRPNLHAQLQTGLVVYERYDDTSKITIENTSNDESSVVWPGPVDMPSLEIARFKDKNGEAKGEFAFFAVNNEQEKLDAIAKIQQEFPLVPVCTDNYQYEVNCIEYREGHGIQTRGNYERPDFTRIPMNNDVVEAMVKAANLGDNIVSLYNHELYYRTKAAQGHRLASAELNAVYDNLSIWLWNNENYQYDSQVTNDELGFKTLVQFLNCYTNNTHQTDDAEVLCPTELGQSLVKNNLIHGNGELNPSYPLNYMEKPLTRIMLGRSFWDHDIVVDTTVYPGRPTQTGTTAEIDIETYRNPVTFAAGNRQATGLWAPQLQNVEVSGGVAATITVALVDDLTGRNNHELALNRPPRVEMNFTYNGTGLTLKVPYGGLIYITPAASKESSVETFTFSNVIKGSYWKKGAWVHGYNSDVPLADIDTGHFIYTTPVLNAVDATNVAQFAEQINAFAEAASDFYGRDQRELTGDHRRFTAPDVLLEHRHHFVNDKQISIGAAHSGYPVQSSSFNVKSQTIPTNPTDDWLLWHEVGHNLAAAPFSLTGSTEVTNNILALYMQEQRAEKPTMERITADLKKIPLWMTNHSGHAWSEADAGIRLVMFGQLKLWAEEHFEINKWYDVNAIPHIFDTEKQGWNLFKLMHRMARGETFNQGSNYCTTQATGLNANDTLMVCASYASGYDLSDFFEQWNPGETKADMPNGESDYSGGITSQGLNLLHSLELPTPAKSPLTYITLSNN
ncbi:SslE/AcfD family lipoprotein zinc metalloprotease [Vibrio kasasachensis]|uniref:SslE/AcfD family lipoprotein zinc metalloprotease n=1 Tax=Vibrio kasasachensis TaxID=2910248 RepID=UPI003D0FB1FE